MIDNHRLYSRYFSDFLLSRDSTSKSHGQLLVSLLKQHPTGLQLEPVACLINAHFAMVQRENGTYDWGLSLSKQNNVHRNIYGWKYCAVY